MFFNKFDEELQSEDFNNIIILNDESGAEIQFEFLDLIDFRGSEYVVLLPVNSNDRMVTILKLVETDENNDLEDYYIVNDDNVLNSVFEIFKIRNKDRYTFI